MCLPLRRPYVSVDLKPHLSSTSRQDKSLAAICADFFCNFSPSIHWQASARRFWQTRQIACRPPHWIAALLVCGLHGPDAGDRSENTAPSTNARGPIWPANLKNYKPTPSIEVNEQVGSYQNIRTRYLNSLKTPLPSLLTPE